MTGEPTQVLVSLVGEAELVLGMDGVHDVSSAVVWWVWWMGPRLGEPGRGRLTARVGVAHTRGRVISADGLVGSVRRLMDGLIDGLIDSGGHEAAGRADEAWLAVRDHDHRAPPLGLGRNMMTDEASRRKGVSRAVTHDLCVPVVVVSRCVEISTELCVSGRDLTEPRPSPTDDTVAFVARWGAESAIVLVPVGGGPERLLTAVPPPRGGRGFGGGCFDWMPDGSAVVYAAADGDLWVQRIDGAPPERLTDHGPDRSAQAPSVSPDGRWVAHVVDHAEVWRAFVDGSTDPDRLDDADADFCADPHAGVDTVRWQAWNVPDMPWDAARTEIVHLGTSGIDRRDQRVGTGAIQQPRTLADGTAVEVRDDTGWLNVWVGDAPLLDERMEHAGPSWGMGQRSYAVSPDGVRLAFTRNEAGFGRLCVLDRATGHVHHVGRGVHGQLGWCGDRLVALRSGARTPTQIVAYRPADGTGGWHRQALVVGAPIGWDHLDLPEPEPFVVDHDGSLIHARRYRAGNGRLICWVHGGPTDQWQVTFMPRISYWWSRGWDVVVPDPRGTTGHGRAYQQALHGEWGRLDVDDTAAVIRHAHSSGWAEPSSTVVMGGSSGGLTALGVLGLHAGLAAGGAVSYPVCDLFDLSEHSHRFEAHYTLSLVGPLDHVELYRDRSPLSYAHRIDVPLLVMHGDADPVVPVEQSLALAGRVRAAGGDVELHILEGEGHGFRDPQNRRHEFEIVGRFLERVMAGRPADADPVPGGR